MTSDPALDPKIPVESPATSDSASPSAVQAEQSNLQWDEENTALLQREQGAIMSDLREQLARAQSDYTNLVRRSREESLQIGQWIEDKTVLKFLPTLDNLERALEHIPEDLKNNAWIEWLSSIVRGMQKVVADFGITPMNAVWQDVDPDFHDVISQIPHSATTIQVEVEKGYMRWEKALRHAKVIVGDGQLTPPE